MPDAEFEKTFADLAHARLRDRAPGLLEHMVGFQLLDKNDDDTHAVGVWGFKLGPEWMYAPVFFLNGQLKGDELLYIKSQDAFVPLKENWINYLLNRRPHVLGETEEQEQGQLGMTQPDFDSLARPPFTGSKYASAGSLRGLVDYLSDRVNSDFRSFLPVVISSPSGEKRAELSTKWHLPNFLKKAGKKAVLTLLNTMKKNAAFGDAVLKFYRMEDIIDAAHTAFAKSAMEKLAAVGDKMIEGTAPTVRVMYADRANVLDLDDTMLTEEEKEKLQSDRYAVRDRRGDGDVATVYNREIGKTLQNPSCCGYTPVLTASGFKKHLVILDPIGGRNYGDAARGDSIAINLDSGNRMIMMPARNIYTNAELHDVEGWKTKFNGLPQPSTCREKDKVIFVNEKCEGSAPFFIKRKVVTDDGRTMLYGEFDFHPRSSPTPDFNREVTFPKFTGRVFNTSDAPRGADGYRNYNMVETCCDGDGICFTITGKDGKSITKIDDNYFVPNGFKAIKVSEKDIERWKLREYERSKKPQTIDGITIPASEPDPDSLASPQTLADIEMQLFKTSNVSTISPVSDGIEYWLKVDGAMSRPMSKLAALEELVVRHQMREKDALMLLKVASKSPPEFIVKKAQGQPNAAPAIPDPAMASDPTLGGGVPVQYPQTDLLQVGSDTEPSRMGEMDMDATFRAQQAAQQGQKEVMDTSVVGGLVKTMDTDSAVDNYIGDLMLGLDRVGRILFMYYWHYEKFKDRYGAQDMPELEDNLKNVFDNMGDLTLFLKQKTIEPEVSGATAEAELTEVL